MLRIVRHKKLVGIIRTNDKKQLQPTSLFGSGQIFFALDITLENPSAVLRAGDWPNYTVDVN